MVELGPVSPVSPAGISMEMFGVNLKAALGGCAHPEAVPVETLGGELVAWLCPGCDERLPPEWVSPAVHREAVIRDHEKRHHGHPQITLLQCRLCAEKAGWSP